MILESILQESVNT